MIGCAVAPEVDGLRRVPGREGRARGGQGGVAMVGRLVVSGQPLALIEPVIRLQAGLGTAGSRGHVLADLVGVRATLQIFSSSIEPVKGASASQLLRPTYWLARDHDGR